MIAYLRGKVFSSLPTELILDVQGVGYQVFITLSTFEEISGKQEVELLIHTIVREDAILLFGFSRATEKEMFELLISITGIGPKSAISILSGIRPEDLRNAIQAGDTSRITAVPGIGKKTAERLVLELRGKVDHIAASGKDDAYPVRSEAIAALSALGYNARNAEKIVREIADSSPDMKLEEVIKQALKRLSLQ
ncbi:MAG: Holliday junction branch migration protein RuvA [Ignavibacteria bacterium]|nr:Holliday junction branch migration protein RuvA [Ignavibacteria bacterium]